MTRLIKKIETIKSVELFGGIGSPRCGFRNIIAGHALVKIESVLEKCGLENVLATLGDKDYIALVEVKKAIRALHKGSENDGKK